MLSSLVIRNTHVSVNKLKHNEQKHNEQEHTN